MKRRMLAGYLIAIHLLLALMLWKSDFIPRVVARVAGKPHPEELSKHFRDMRQYHSRSALLVPKGSVFFIGDSIIQGLCVDAVVQPAVNYGIGGDTTAGVMERLGDYALDRASAVVLCIGGNDFKYRGLEAIAANVERIIARIDSRCPVVISSILPADESVSDSLRGENADIAKLNVLLRALAATSPRLTYADHSNLSEAGQLRRDLHIGDGMHPNNEGNRLLADNFRAAIHRILKAGDSPEDTMPASGVR